MLGGNDNSIPGPCFVAHLASSTPIPVEYLALQHWPDSGDGQARGSLRKLLFNLPTADSLARADLQHLARLPDSSRVKVAMNVVRFEQPAAPHRFLAGLERAVSLYRGDALLGIYDGAGHASGGAGQPRAGAPRPLGHALATVPVATQPGGDEEPARAFPARSGNPGALPRRRDRRQRERFFPPCEPPSYPPVRVACRRRAGVGPLRATPGNARVTAG